MTRVMIYDSNRFRYAISLSFLWNVNYEAGSHDSKREIEVRAAIFSVSLSALSTVRLRKLSFPVHVHRQSDSSYAEAWISWLMTSILRGVGHEDRSCLCSRDKSRIVISAAIWSFHDCTESDRFRSLARDEPSRGCRGIETLSRNCRCAFA
jgi:hypothetical protein